MRMDRARTPLAVCCMLALGWLAHPAAAQLRDDPAAGADMTIIRGGWLFDGVADDRVRNTGILIANRKFMEVGANLAGRDLSGARVIDLGDDMTILPGMFDLHAHHNMNLVGGGRTDEANYLPVIWLANGVTSTFPAGEYDPVRMYEARRRIDAGEQVGARIFGSGPYWGAGRCDGVPGLEQNDMHDTCEAWPADITEEEIRAEVDYWAERGVKGLKIKQATPEQMRILIDHAHRRGLTTTTHLHQENFRLEVHPRDAILMGLDRFEHTLAATEDILFERSVPGSAAFNDLHDLAIRHGVYLDHTAQGAYCSRTLTRMGITMDWVDMTKYYTPYLQERRRRQANQPPGPPQPRDPVSLRTPENQDRICDHKMKSLKALYDRGGAHLIVAGTDTPGNLGGFTYHRELQAHAAAGLPPLQVLRSATINGARALRVGDILGSIEVGKLADLVIVQGNPLERIEETRNVRTVIKAGVVYDSKELLSRVEGKIGPAGPGEEDAWKYRGAWSLKGSSR
jgi:imidazolonepropionase-like amidohydrolase